MTISWLVQFTRKPLHFIYLFSTTHTNPLHFSDSLYSRTIKNKAMAPKKKRARKQKRKNYEEESKEAENVSQSESTNLNNASDSWECPTSARRSLTENHKEVSTRRRNSLRSAAKPIQNGGHSSAPDDIQQVDDPVDTIHSECQGLGKDSDKKESPSRSLVSSVPPSTLQLVPLEKEILEGEITNDNQRKCALRGGCPSLSEMVAMMENENGDEVDSEIPGRAETVNGYHVKMEFMPILRRIIDKHGDIARNCVTESVKHRSELLEIICGIISDFEKKDVRSIKESSLKDKIALVDGLRNMKVEVEWLHTRLTEVVEAKEILMQSSELKQKATKNRKLVEQSELELEECEALKKELTEKLKAVCEKETLSKENLARAKDESAGGKSLEAQEHLAEGRSRGGQTRKEQIGTEGYQEMGRKGGLSTMDKSGGERAEEEGVDIDESKYKTGGKNQNK